MEAASCQLHLSVFVTLQVLNETTMTWNAANPPLLEVSRMMAPLKPVVLNSHAAGFTRL